jgi:hypothetical protein
MQVGPIQDEGITRVGLECDSISRRQFHGRTDCNHRCCKRRLICRHAFVGGAVKYPLGVQLYMVGTDLKADVNGTLKKIRAIGYQHVESFSLAGLTAPQFRKALDDADLKCHSSHLMFNGDDLSPLFAQANALGQSMR